jgi:hypothetical protein
MFVSFDSEEFNNSECLRKSYWDIGRAAAYLSDTRLNRKSAVVRFSYCADLDCFYVVWWVDEAIRMTKMATEEGEIIHLSDFQRLHNSYLDAFVTVREETSELYTQERFDKISCVWAELYKLFILPLLSLVAENEINIFIGLYCHVANNRYVLDFNLLYNYKFRMFIHPANENIYFVTVTTDWLHSFIKNLIGLIAPKMSDIKIVYGFKPFDSPESLAEAPTAARREAAILREKIFTLIRDKAVRDGKGVVYLHGLGDLQPLLQKGGDPCFIQLLSHYHSRRLSTRSPKSIRFKDILELVDALNSRGDLSEDICIDAFTCTNFSDFRSLYEKGVKYLNLSHHALSTDLTAYMLFEFYTGENANCIGWDYPYLDGNCHMHEAWAKINRCFFTRMAGGSQISIL